MNRNKLILIFSFLLIFIIQASSQVAFTGKELYSEFNRGMDLFNKEKYPAAIRLFDSFIKSNKNQNYILVTEAEYYSAVAALRLFNADAEYRMETYLSAHPESPRLNEARLALGDYSFQNKNYKKAATYYESVDRHDLKSDKLPEYFFRFGYSLYISGNKDKALLMFSEIKDMDTEYTPPAVYYSAQIAYEQKMYQSAMDGFMRLKDDETFGSIVPYYIVQILYIQKDYDGILSMAPDLINSAGKERAVELYRFIGDAYYNKGKYKEASDYLEKYSDEAKASGREDKYQLGYCYYKTGRIDEAIKMLLETGAKDDILSQNIWNILGDCYLQKGDKKRAQLAFGEASKMNYDKKLKEESLFNYAKLTYETSYSPFGETIAAFQEYIDLYPESDKIQEAYDYLVATYMQMKNYKLALASLDKIQNKDSKLEEAYQRVAFYRGLELFKNLEIEASINMFEKSLKYEKYNRSIRARAVYWHGEALYRLADYDEAKTDFETFMGIPGSMKLDEYDLVRYNLGYTMFNLKDYTNALNHFKAFEADPRKTKPEIMTDAMNRIADCYYIATDYKPAIEYYDKVIGYGNTDADYAMFQKGFCLGLINDSKGKINTMTSLAAKYPSSSYVPNAIFERGRAYLVLEDYKKGEADFNKVISDYPNSQFVPRAMVQLGLLYYNLGENEKAIYQYKKVIENFKSTPEARYAMTGLKNTYVDVNDVESYFSYVKTLDGYGDVNMAEKDSLLYTSAENLYMERKYDQAVSVLKNYLEEFPNGSFKLNVQYCLAECLKSTGNMDEALVYYTAVADEPNNQFLEQALISASVILFDKEEYGKSFEYYERLENTATNDENRLIALAGELKSAYQDGDAEKTIAVAGKIKNSENVPEELAREAIFMNAKANYSLNNFDEALVDFRKVATEVTSTEGAESKYRVAELLNRKGMTDESEKIISEFIKQNTPHQYWMARMFLLLSEISVKKGDLLQAKATLQSLKDYYSVSDDGILDEVNTMLDSLDKANSVTTVDNENQQNKEN
ncbi:MAG TPA: tetratricopeptide repeat protein [Bacteroidales bacterium]|nr:tetratricopeptide repeat protein [Bacteroidales bacterium]HPT20852.1 tetratricopeptide repeat protein [Bacteroidales bacterium]